MLPTRVPKQDTVYSFNRLEALWTAAVKYEMALPIEVLRKQLLEAAGFSPIAAWAVASRVGLEILARRAAEKTLETSLKVAESDLVGVTAADFYRLREFHRADGHVPVDFRLLTPSKQTTSDSGAHTTVPSSEPFILKQNMPFADLICRSSDGVEFEVHRWVISTSSAMLYHRITSIESANIHEKPVLKLDEDSTVVSALLGLCYQPSGELTTNPTSLYNVLVAAQKYEMEGVMKAVQNRWAKSPAQGVDVLSFYLIAACLTWWKEITQVVAAYTLSDPLPSAEEQPQVLMPTSAPLYSPFMESTPAVVYLRLIRYHETYQTAMQEILQRSRCQLPLSKVLYKAILSPHDAISFTSQAVIESYQHGRTQGKKEYYANISSTDDTQRLQNALNEVAKLMKEVSMHIHLGA